MITECILNSLIAFQGQKETRKFITDVPAEVFDDTFRPFYVVIQDLAMSDALNLASFSAECEKRKIQNNAFISILAATPEANILNAKPLLMAAYNRRRQAELVAKWQEQLKKGENVDFYSDLSEVSFGGSGLKVENFVDLERKFDEIKPIRKVLTNIDWLDDALNNPIYDDRGNQTWNGGFQTGQLVLISGDKDTGKTSLGLQILQGITISEKVCYATLEFNWADYVGRVKRLNPAELPPMNKANLQIMYNENDDNVTVADLTRAIIAEFYKSGTRIFLIDSQMMVRAPKGYNQADSEAVKFTSLLNLCNNPRFNFLIFFIVQTSKDKNDRDPQGSKNGGHAAKIMLHLRLQKENEKNGPRIIEFVKNKQNSFYGQIPLKLCYGSQCFVRAGVVEKEFKQ